MKTLALAFGLLAATALSPLAAAPEVGAPAPDFTGTTTTGDTITLSELTAAGQRVVLEWTNHDCPFVVKHYDSGNMQMTQREATADGDVTWVTVISSAPGKQGHVDAATADSLTKSREAAPTHVVLDPSGEIGQLYAAKTTPHMFVIDTDGTLAYAGAIDSIPSPRQSDLADAENYVLSALADLEVGQPVRTTQSKPYGCSVKY